MMICNNSPDSDSHYGFLWGFLLLIRSMLGATVGSLGAVLGAVLVAVLGFHCRAGQHLSQGTI